MQTGKIGVLAGSARKGAFSVQVATAVAGMLPPQFETELLQLSGLPLFNQEYDEEGTTPESWKVFREKVATMDGYLFVTPEYNRSYTPLLKNALDIASRPAGQNRWGKKPGALLSTSPGSLGGFGANHHLRQVLSFLNIYLMPQPEAYISNVGAMFAADGAFLDAQAQQFLEKFAAAFAEWLKKF